MKPQALLQLLSHILIPFLSTLLTEQAQLLL